MYPSKHKNHIKSSGRQFFYYFSVSWLLMLLNYACRHVELGGTRGRRNEGANGDVYTCQWIVEELKQRGYRPKLIDLEKGGKPEPPSWLEGLLILSQAPRVGHDFLKSAFHLLQQAGPVLRQAGQNGGAVLAIVSRLDGAFGLYGLNGKSDLLSGGLAGLSKTARHEWPDVHCKAMDIDAGDDNVEQIARAIADEMLLEWLGHGAMHGNPDLKFHGFNDLEIHSRLALDGNETVPIRMRAGRARGEGYSVLSETRFHNQRKSLKLGPICHGLHPGVAVGDKDLS